MTSSSNHFSAVAQRYASAVFDLAQEKKSVDKTAKAFAALRATIANNADLKTAVHSPVISVAALSEILKAVLKALKADVLTQNSVLLMVEKRRAAYIIETADALASRVAQANGQVTAHVTSATELSETQLATLTAQLTKQFKQDIHPVVTIDPSLIAGLRVQVGSRMIDASVFTKLQSLQLSLKGA